MFSASLQIKGWHLAQKLSSSITISPGKVYKVETGQHPLTAAKSRLLALESGLERRYLKHPFRVETHGAKTAAEPLDTSSDALHSSNVQGTTPALRLWREAVEDATSAAQLSMSLSMLDECVAWEKSIMKVVRIYLLSFGLECDVYFL